MLDTLSAAKIADICGGVWTKAPKTKLMGVQIDSRAMRPSDLFIALPGTQADGHEFVPHLNALQHQAAIVAQPNNDCDVPQLSVDRPLSALKALASHIASETTAQKIAVTGSVGKTGTKDMLLHCLAPMKRTHATKGNLNNDIGAPLTIARMRSDTDILICELGMNHAGEITALSTLMKPAISIITRIADSHRGHFNSLADIARAKAEIFSGMSKEGIAILPADDVHFDILVAAAKQAGITKIMTFGRQADCDMRLIDQQLSEAQQTIQANICGTQISFTLGMAAPHWAYSALICLGVVHHLDLSVQKAADSLAVMRDIPGRGASFSAHIDQNLVSIVNDAYNAGPASMEAALALLATQSGRKSAILSDMLELGDLAPEAHQALAGQIVSAGITTLLLIGPFMAEMASQLPRDIIVTNIADADSAKAAAKKLAATSDHLLIKGSHGSGAWKLASYLQEFMPADMSSTVAHMKKGGPDAT